MICKNPSPVFAASRLKDFGGEEAHDDVRHLTDAMIDEGAGLAVRLMDAGLFL